MYKIVTKETSFEENQDVDYLYTIVLIYVQEDIVMFYSYINQGKAETLGEIRKKKEQVETKTEKKETEKKEANQNITKIQNDLATQQTRERELLDNLQLRKKTKEIDDVQQKIGDLKEQLGDIDVTHLDRERKRLKTQQEELMKEVYF